MAASGHDQKRKTAVTNGCSGPEKQPSVGVRDDGVVARIMAGRSPSFAAQSQQRSFRHVGTSDAYPGDFRVR
jgi:hypothetical protein